MPESKIWTSVSVSISTADVETTLRDIKTIAKRERRSRSSIIVDAMKEYADRHIRGNAQTLLSSYANEGPITQALIEGEIRQECLNYAKKVGHITQREVIEITRQKITSGGHLVAMVERVIIWLKAQDVEVWQ